MSSGIAYLDGVDWEDLGIELLAIPNLWSAPTSSIARITAPFYHGARFTHNATVAGVRQWQLQAYNRETTDALVETAMQTVKDAVTDRRSKLSFANAPNRGFYGVCEAFNADIHALGVPGWSDVGMVFTCDDPFSVDDALTIVSGYTSERVAVQVGSGPTYPYIIVTGAATTPTLTARDYTGKSLGTMTTTSLDGNDCWIIETVNGGMAWRSNDGVIASDMANLTAGYTFPVFSPRDGNRALSLWPTLETSAGTIEVRYARRWR